jgi:3-hydroxybutyryl-CoA dehydrogenase
MTPDAVKTIAVIGGGTMGQGIAQVCATAGYKVLLYDIQPELIHAAISSIQKNLNTLVEKGKMDIARKENIIGLISGASDFRHLQVEMVIEAVVEKLEIKQKIFSELEKVNDRNCILVTNTSSIPITQIASALKYTDRFAGLHFFNPAPAMKLVEIVKGTTTADSTIEFLFDFTKKLAKHAVLTQDSPGFIVNRVARQFYVESLKIAEENVTNFESIDRLMRSTGFKMGPFELMDLIGVDVNFSVTTSMYHAFHEDPKFRPSRLQQQKVNAGHHGRKTGRGFYTYTKE